MTERQPENDAPNFDFLFALAVAAPNVQVAGLSAEILKQMHAIQQLEVITRQVDSPYIASYLSV